MAGSKRQTRFKLTHFIPGFPESPVKILAHALLSGGTDVRM